MVGWRAGKMKSFLKKKTLHRGDLTVGRRESWDEILEDPGGGDVPGHR